MHLTQEYTEDIEHRFKYATIVVLALILIVAGRLYYLQVIRGSFYRFFSTENSIKSIRIPAARGMMLDRRGQVLVENRPAYNIIVVPQYVQSPDKTLDTLATLLSMPRDELSAIWERRRLGPYYQPLVVKADVSQDEVALVRARKNPWNDDSDDYDLRGVDVEVGYRRTYPESNIATHALGYVREIDPERLKAYRARYPGQYEIGDMVGLQGIEERWDLYLRGTDGYADKIVNAVGREVDFEGIAAELSIKPAEAGASLKLTLDRDMQEVARDLFGERSGAAVVVDVRSGGIVTMYSSPSYDLNLLSGPDGSEYWGELSTDPSHPLLNRAIQGAYPPGSTYKIVNAIGALSEGVVRPDETIRCGGALAFGNRAFRCSRRGGHGPIEFHRAIVASCDVYFYLMGLRLGVDRLAKYAHMMGLGEPTGVPLSGEKPGLIPTSEWKLKRFGVPWQEGETISIAIGQGYDLETPIQNALVAAQVANGGKKLSLHLVDAAFDAQGNEIYRWEPPEGVGSVPIDPAIMKMVKDAMVGVVAEPGGTGHAQSTRKVTMGGKTGTAQVVELGTSAVCRGISCKDHGWFIAFAPADNPEIAAAVIVEHGGFGASAAAPVVGALMEKYYGLTP